MKRYLSKIEWGAVLYFMLWIVMLLCSLSSTAVIYSWKSAEFFNRILGVVFWMLIGFGGVFLIYELVTRVIPESIKMVLMLDDDEQ